MKRTMKQWLSLAAAGMMALSMSSCADLTGKIAGIFGKDSASILPEEGQVEKYTPIILNNVTQAKNVILMIGDGMGPNQIKAGELYRDEPLVMQGFPYMTMMETRSANNYITDSAAAATALATGVRTYNATVGQTPEGEDLETIVDIAASLGKRTGIIATEVLTGATPMGFAAHAENRGDEVTLIKSAIATSNVNLFASYNIKDGYKNGFVEGGYEKIDDPKLISESTSDKVFGSYWIHATAPSMSGEMDDVALDFLVTEALEYLSKDEDGFFLMAEGSHIDHGGHKNDIKYMLEELLAFDDAVKAVLKWAENRNDTVVIVTADHETGGLELDPTMNHDLMAAVFEDPRIEEGYVWTTDGHTGVDVCFYVNGADIDFAKYSFQQKDRIQNVDTFSIIKDLMMGV